MCYLTPLVKAMFTGFQEWQAKRGKSTAGQDKGTNSDPYKGVSTATSQEQAATTGVLSYNQMRRLSVGGHRPPSEVGSVRSYRSVRTIEDRVDSLEASVTGIMKNQDIISAKLDALLEAVSKPPSQTQGSSDKQTIKNKP